MVDVRKKKKRTQENSIDDMPSDRTEEVHSFLISYRDIAIHNADRGCDKFLSRNAPGMLGILKRLPTDRLLLLYSKL